MYILKEKTAAVSAMKAVACVGSHKNKRYDAAAAGGWDLCGAREKFATVKIRWKILQLTFVKSKFVSPLHFLSII